MLLIAIIVLARCHTYHEPVERDLALYAVFGHEMLQGRPLYTDLFDNKPPLIYLTYAFSELIAGYGQQQFFFLGLLAAILTLLGVYRLGSTCVGARGGFWAAVFWTFLCSDLLLQANQPNVEVFINLTMVWALAFLVPKPRSPWNYFFAGIMLALSSLYKLVGIQFVILFPLVVLFLEAKGRRLVNALRSFVLLAIPMVAGWLGLALYFKLNGRWQDFFNALYVLNSGYAGDMWPHLWEGLSLKNFFYAGLLFLTPLLLLVVPALFRNLGKNPWNWLFFAAYAIGTYFSVARTGRFFSHYYQLWLPLAAIGGGWAAVILGDWLGTLRRGKRLRWAPAALCLGFILFHEIPNYALTPDQWSEKKYGDEFLVTRDLAQRLSEILKPDEDFFHFTKDPNLYFYSRKRPPTGILYIDHALCGPVAEILISRYKKNLAANPAEMMVMDKTAFTDQYQDLLNGFVFWKFFPKDGRYALLVAKGGKLEARLKKSGLLPPLGSGNPLIVPRKPG